ncbi:hypothetical protein ACS47_03820 [Bacillus cereus]|uniref:hypothetical protein n=1 Tax=Bacillus cereus group TaxID=86661 RepID=UPI00027982DC|nr:MULTISPECIES: hypothetical protein [Bacillus cereus group]EJQ00610.1 hypothetical protein IAU_00152 [Bacillus cereus IS075]EOO86799.1 hypothetical protein IGS_04109 [Bacillus cereus IS845/00]EOO95513.1 hypothetical protein IGQ_03866 [Bacillus cereus IS195]KKZ95619.1 hypothetical protein B4153_2398 [Bacillus cereus]KMP80961.1 hypothetical protein TU63_26380 [Bacillus cereus]
MEIKLFNFEDKEESIVCYYQDGNFFTHLGSLLIQFKFKVNFYPICGVFRMRISLEDSNIQEENISLEMVSYFITDKSYAIAALPVVDHLEEIIMKQDKMKLLNLFKEELFQMLETQFDDIDYAQYRFVFLPL